MVQFFKRHRCTADNVYITMAEKKRGNAKAAVL